MSVEFKLHNYGVEQHNTVFACINQHRRNFFFKSLFFSLKFTWLADFWAAKPPIDTHGPLWVAPTNNRAIVANLEHQEWSLCKSNEKAEVLCLCVYANNESMKDKECKEISLSKWSKF